MFNVAVLRNAPNIKAIHSAKATGEPPLNLASSVFFAIKNAVAAARYAFYLLQECGRSWKQFCRAELGFDVNDVFRFDSPATVERIALAASNVRFF